MIPWSEEAEVSVVGAVFLEPDVIGDVRSLIEPGSFFREAHRHIYRAAVELYDEGDAIDVVTVSEKLGDKLSRAGGLDYLAHVLDAVPSAANAKHHARIVAQKARLRGLVEACRVTAERATDPHADPDEVLRGAEERILGPAYRGEAAEYEPASQSVHEALAYIEEAQASPDGIIGLRTGFGWLDKLTGGLRKGDLTVLAARPSHGKSALAWQLAHNPATKGHAVAVASYEMSRARLLHRGLAAASRLDSHDLRTGRMTPNDSKALAAAAQRLSKLPLYIQYPPPRTVEGLRSDLRRLMRREPIELFVVDYLQQMDGRGQNRNNEVEHISRNLKRMAGDLDVHVIALSQLSRGVDHRSPPRPMLSDLRDSGAIEQDADNVLMLWRPQMYFDDTTPEDQWARWQNKGELIVAKQRDGDTGRVILMWDGPTTTFTELDTTQLGERHGGN